MKHLISRHYRLLTVAIACVALGVGISAITSAGAASTKSSTHSGARLGRFGRRAGIVRRAVTGQIVVHTKRNGFQTVSFQRGKVDSVSGASLTLTEGTRQASYRSVTVTIPADARIRDNGSRTGLSSLEAGQRVLVVTGPRRTFVIARTPKSG
jgi:hypothetical protein